MKKWKCSVCGYVHTGDTPPEKCPVCGADQSLFTLMDSGAGAEPVPEPPSPSPATAAEKTSQWRCTVCGYIHTGESPPEKCPVCGADKSLFVLVQASTPDPSGNDHPSPEPAGKAPEGTAARPSFVDRIQQLMKQKPYDDIAQRLTQLHGHPVAVHIPNGLLPVSILFTVFAIIFGTEGFATAARYNTCLVALAMPVVIITGLIDWMNRFNGRMTQVFKVKMICAGIVALLSIILAIWWIAAPDLFSKGIISNLFFLLLNFANLGAAVVAGWYGGKLVFRT